MLWHFVCLPFSNVKRASVSSYIMWRNVTNSSSLHSVLLFHYKLWHSEQCSLVITVILRCWWKIRLHATSSLLQVLLVKSICLHVKKLFNVLKVCVCLRYITRNKKNAYFQKWKDTFVTMTQSEGSSCPSPMESWP